MKLSTETISLLKNFASINQGIYFRKGNTIKTVSDHKNILAEAKVSENFEVDFGVYDLNNFLSVITLHKDEPEFTFDEKQAVISGNNGRSKINYRFCEPSMLVLPPDKELIMPEPEISFTLSQEDLEWIIRAAGVLSSPNIAVQSNGSKISIVTFDSSNDAAHTDALEVSDGNGDSFKMVFKTENLRMVPGSYHVTISSEGVSNFKNVNKELQYWITTESGSTFTKG